MTIIDLGRTTPITNRTSPEDPFFRAIVLGPFTTDAALISAFPGLDESVRETVSVTGVTTAEGATFTEQDSRAGALALQQSYYWDSVAQTLYLHLPPSDPPMATTYLYGLAEGFSTGRPVYIDNVRYLPLIVSSPGIRQQQDIENYDRLSFITGAVTLSNADGRLDNLKDQPVYGNDVVIYYLDANEPVDNFERADLTRLATLFVEDYDISLQEIGLRVQDRRKNQNVRIPDARFTQAAYSEADPELWGTVIPVLWGEPREIPTVITNGAGTTPTDNVKHRAALLLTALGTVYVQDEEEWVDVTAQVTNINLATGEFEIPAAQGRDANDVPLPAKLVEPTGIAITYLTDIIKDATERFTGVAYNSSTYDTTEWEAEETAIASGAYYLDEERELFEVIRDVQNGANVGFRYEITPEGLRTIRVDDETRTAAAAIPNIVIANRDRLRVTTDSATLAAEVVVAYGRSYVSGRSLRVVDDGSSDSVLETYRQRPRKSYETLLTASADAEERAVYVRDRFDTIRGIVELELMGADYLTTRIYDILTVEITPDEPTNMRRAYYGEWKVKVLSVEPDTERAVTAITAVLIEEA